MRREKGKGLTTGDTKTYAGTRTITLPPSLAALLKERKRAAKTAWIFPDLLRPERPTAPDAAYRRMKLLLEQAGLPDIRFHDLRHTFAPHALTSGVDVKTLSGILGHTRAAFTLDTYVTNREKTVERLISGVNCVAQTAQDEFEAVKKQFHKTDGRSYYHIVQAFAPDDPLDFDTAHEIGLKFAEYFKGYQCVVVTHMNTAHIHNHIIMNSVNFKNGQKFHQSAREMQQAKEYSNQLCREYGLSFTESKADPFRIPAWKKRLCRTIKEAMENCATREEFIAFMAEYGYKVRWEPNQKYITYTTPENVRCRDNKLFDQTLLRSSMEAYFDMGGCEYLESRIDATEYGELLPTVDDAVCGLISILDALNTGDNDRFHLETLHHSKQEIQRILERGGKIDRTVEYAVDDEEEEYEQYHGFSMRM